MARRLSVTWIRKAGAFASWLGGRHGTARRRDREKQLGLEVLESRQMMSAAGSTGLLRSAPVAAASALAASSQTEIRAPAKLAGLRARLDFVFRDFYEVDNSPAQAKNISLRGVAQSHSLHTASDVDWLKFTLSERSNVVIQTAGRAGDTEMWLFGPNTPAQQIAYDNDSGDGAFSRIARSGQQALEPGTYYVKIGEFGSNATVARYTITVQATPAGDAFETDDTWQQAKPIAVDAGPQNHSIHVPSDVDWATFTLTTAADVVIETRGSAGDTRLWLYGSDPTAAPIEFDDDDGVGRFSVIVRSGVNALPAGTYYVKVDESGNNAAIAAYSLSVTALQQGDVLLVQGKGGVSAAIRWGEARELNVPLAETFSHAAVYVGNGSVAEMLAEGFTITSLADRYAASNRVDLVRHRDIGLLGTAVAQAALAYANTPYAFAQIGVFATAALNPGRPDRVMNSTAWTAYQSTDSGPRRMICSELVARAFADADPNLKIDVVLWPTLAMLPNQTEDFRMDFTSPTMLARSPDLRRLNA